MLQELPALQDLPVTQEPGGLQVLPVLQEPREHKVLQASPDLPAHRDRLALPDPQDHRGLPDQQALRGQWNPGDSPVRQGHGGLRDLWDFQDLRA